MDTHQVDWEEVVRSPKGVVDRGPLEAARQRQKRDRRAGVGIGAAILAVGLAASVLGAVAAGGWAAVPGLVMAAFGAVLAAGGRPSRRRR